MPSNTTNYQCPDCGGVISSGREHVCGRTDSERLDWLESHRGYQCSVHGVMHYTVNTMDPGTNLREAIDQAMGGAVRYCLCHEVSFENGRCTQCGGARRPDPRDFEGGADTRKDSVAIGKKGLAQTPAKPSDTPQPDLRELADHWHVCMPSINKWLEQAHKIGRDIGYQQGLERALEIALEWVLPIAAGDVEPSRIAEAIKKEMRK